MRIAIFSDNFYPELSGVSDSILALGKELAKRGHAIFYSVPVYPARAFRLAHVPVHELDLGPRITIERRFSFPFPGSPTGQGRFVIPVPRLTALVRTFAPEVVHTQFFFGMGLAARSVARQLTIPLIGTSHTATREFLSYSPFRTVWLDRCILGYMNWFYSKCDLVTAPSASVFKEMRADGFKGKSQVISNPIDTAVFSPRAGSERKNLKQKFGFGPHTLFHAGRFSAERHIDVLIKAFAETRRVVPDAELAIAGRGIMEPALRERARILGLDTAVKFLGVLDAPVLAEAYNASEAFLIASTCETQSLVLMQAFACGLPAVGVRARALPEYLNPHRGFLAEPGDSRAIGTYAARLLLDSPLRTRLGTSAREFAEHFSVSSITNQWEQIYEETIARYHKRTWG